MCFSQQFHQSTIVFLNPNSLNKIWKNQKHVKIKKKLIKDKNYEFNQVLKKPLLLQCMLFFRLIYHDAVRGELESWEGSDHTVFRHVACGVPCTHHTVSTGRTSDTLESNTWITFFLFDFNILIAYIYLIESKCIPKFDHKRCIS